MEGIQQLFHEFSAPDEYEVGYQLELFAWRASQRKRENERNRYRFVQAVPAMREARAEYKREWVSQWRKRKLRTDSAWRDKTRTYKREQMARLRAQARAA